MKKPTAFGKYFLLERINVGGMAEVFRSKAFGVEGFERLVAVKRILPSVAEDKEFIRTFIEEAKLSVQLNHANIAQIFDLGVVDGSYYIALEHVHGRDLRAIFERCRALGETMALAQACFIAMKVCEGLDYAHNKRDQAGRELALVHRDVSPQNILVSFEGEVKLIDFGVAKAAGAGPATQTSILKDKLGYMSPEQAHGLTTTQPHHGSAGDSDSFAADAFASGAGTLPQGVDRRSDVYSCGIVLYELITGERLFAGDDPFATIRKIRGAEILAPSTYNRRIPDELERIVLKALAKNPGDRYQSAIDFHDELQAFVYTTGEFYSRKDLAAWMKKTFAKEIEDETAKLESYRQLKPPTADDPLDDTIEDADLFPAVSGSLSVIARPAPSKPSRSGAAIKLPSSSGPGSRPLGAPSRSREPSIPLPAATLVSPPITIVSPPPPEALKRGAHADEPTQEISDGSIEVASRGSMARLDPAAIGWEDDEVETQIYKDQEPTKKPARRPSLPSQPPVGSSAGIPLPTAEPASGVEISPELEADLGKIPSLAKPAERSARNPRSVVAKLPTQDPEPTEPVQTVSGEFSAMGTTEVSESDMPPPRFDLHDDSDAAPRIAPREISAASRLVSAAPPARERRHDPSAPFGARFTDRRRETDRRRNLVIALASSALGVIVVIAYLLVSRGEPVHVPAPTVTKPATAPTDPSTGFDLYVTPSGVMQWKLDGESRTDRLPSRIRGISPGTHTVQIEPPPGFLTESRQVVVESGKSSRVEIKLQPMTGIVGTFESTPAAAMVSLIVDGKRQVLGASPAKAVLDPRSTYQVLFEKPGYVSVNRPIQLSGGLDERVSVTLERATGDTAPRAAPRNEAAAPGDASPQGQGALSLSSKPPCEILVDGEPTGLRTPQSGIPLPAGRRQITLVNSELAIRDTFTVDIKPDGAEKVIKDYSDRLPR